MARGLAAFALALLLATVAAPRAPAQSVGRMDEIIKAMPPAPRGFVIEHYLFAQWTFQKFLKFPEAPRVYVSCPGKGCDPAAAEMLERLRSAAPATLGERVDKTDMAGIEIYLAPQPDEFDRRDRAVDAALRLDANITGKKVPKFDSPGVELVPAPCWTVTYFDMNTGTIGKSLVFIDSDETSHMQSLCMGFELVRAVGVMNTENVIAYRRIERDMKEKTFRWLAINAHLHGLRDIQPSDTMAKAYRFLADRYGLKPTP